MTAPISFPTLAPPQLAPQRGGQLDGFAEFLLALQNQRDERSTRRAQLDMQRRGLESNLESDKLTREKTKRDIDISDMKIKAEEVADRYAREAMTTPGLDEKGVSEIIGRMLTTEDKKLAPYLVEAFGQQFGAHQKTLASVAERQTAQVGARVAGATEGAQVRRTKAEASRSETEAGVSAATANARVSAANTEASTARIENQIKHAQANGLDPQRQAAAISAWQTANDKPWKVFAKQFGIPAVKGGIDPDELPTPKANGQNSLNEAFAGNAQLANSLLNDLGNKGLTKLTYLRLGAGDIRDAVLSTFTDPKQKQLLQAYQSIVNLITPIAERGRATDADVQRWQRALVTRADEDNEDVGKQKALLRNAFVLNFASSQPGKAKQSVADFIATAKKIGVTSPELLAPFASLLRAAETADKNPDGPSYDNIISDVTRRPPPKR